ncbi:MAG: FAD-dependent oxidoreductase [Ktedonobacteraceae bacterium]
MNSSTLPVAIIGAGPVGLAAATHLLRQGETPLVLEAGTSIGASVLAWGHVRLFSPWRYLIDREAASLLETVGWNAPDPDTYPTGNEFVEDYLLPLAAVPHMQRHLQLQSRVLSVTRQRMDKMKTPGRERVPFVLRIRSSDGEERDILARAVIDASGTYDQPNPLGANGIHALGEQALSDAIFYGIPDVRGQHRTRYIGRRVLVVGSGHSAFNALLDLTSLAEQEPSTQIIWAIRRHELQQLFGGGERDGLPARGQLGSRIQDGVKSGRIHLITGVSIEALSRTQEGIIIVGEEERIGPVDEVIATTGFRPDLSLFRELRVALDPSVESPVALAPLIDPNIHSCGTVPPHGVDELSHPEENFYIVGMKSYGRAPTFLTLTGYEQVRSIVAALVGDWDAARDVQLELPETGVCSTDAGGSCGVPSTGGRTAAGVESTSCCTPARQLVTLGVARKTTEICCG